MEKLEIQLFFNARFICYMEIPENLDQDAVVAKATEHLPASVEISNVRARYVKGRYLNLLTIQK